MTTIQLSEIRKRRKDFEKEKIVREMEKLRKMFVEIKGKEEIEGRNKAVDKREEFIERTAEELDMRNEEVERKGKAIDTREECVERRGKELDIREECIKRRDEELDVREEWMERRYKEFNAREEEIEERDKTIHIREEKIDERDKTICVKEEYIARRDKLLDGREKEIEERDIAIDKREEFIERIGKKLDAREEYMKERVKELDMREECMERKWKEFDVREEEIKGRHEAIHIREEYIERKSKNLDLREECIERRKNQLERREKRYVEKEIKRKREEKEKLREEIGERKKIKLYDSLMEMDKLPLVINKEQFECPICFSDIKPGGGIVLRECLHTFCRKCLEKVITFSETVDVKCPYSNEDYSCESCLLQKEVKSLLGPEKFQFYLQRSMNFAERQALDSYHCKTPDCCGWCFYDENVNNFVCPVCMHTNCLTCSAIHEGLNCREYQDDTSEETRKTRECLGNMLKLGKAMQCPCCGVILMKNSGCDWLTCSMCKTELCWITKQQRWGQLGRGDTSGGCQCNVNGVKCHPNCNNCH